MYGYTFPLFYECYMRYEPHLMGIYHPIDHVTISNYTTAMFSCYPSFLTQELEQWTSSVV